MLILPLETSSTVRAIRSAATVVVLVASRMMALPRSVAAPTVRVPCVCWAGPDDLTASPFETRTKAP